MEVKGVDRVTGSVVDADEIELDDLSKEAVKTEDVASLVLNPSSTTHSATPILDNHEVTDETGVVSKALSKIKDGFKTARETWNNLPPGVKVAIQVVLAVGFYIAALVAGLSMATPWGAGVVFAILLVGFLASSYFATDNILASPSKSKPEPGEEYSKMSLNELTKKQKDNTKEIDKNNMELVEAKNAYYIALDRKDAATETGTNEIKEKAEEEFEIARSKLNDLNTKKTKLEAESEKLAEEIKKRNEEIIKQENLKKMNPEECYTTLPKRTEELAEAIKRYDSKDLEKMNKVTGLTGLSAIDHIKYFCKNRRDLNASLENMLPQGNDEWRNDFSDKFNGTWDETKWKAQKEKATAEFDKLQELPGNSYYNLCAAMPFIECRLGSLSEQPSEKGISMTAISKMATESSKLANLLEYEDNLTKEIARLQLNHLTGIINAELSEKHKLYETDVRRIDNKLNEMKEDLKNKVESEADDLRKEIEKLEENKTESESMILKIATLTTTNNELHNKIIPRVDEFDASGNYTVPQTYQLKDPIGNKVTFKKPTDMIDFAMKCQEWGNEVQKMEDTVNRIKARLNDIPVPPPIAPHEPPP